VRSSLPAEEKSQLVDALDRSLADGWSRFETVVSPRSRDVNMTIEEMRQYLHGFRFRMTAAEYQAIGKFRQLDEASRLAKTAG
jgi:hypothetical protein